jgi:hypothetical protein
MIESKGLGLMDQKRSLKASDGRNFIKRETMNGKSMLSLPI